MADAKYTEGIGRRKTSVARVRITEADTQALVVNEKPGEEYFPVAEYIKKALEPLAHEDVTKTFAVSVKVNGGGPSSQAEAVRHGLARALEKNDSKLRSSMKEEGWLTRDQRSKERKKPGLRKARKAPQWSKR